MIPMLRRQFRTIVQAKPHQVHRRPNQPFRDLRPVNHLTQQLLLLRLEVVNIPPRLSFGLPGFNDAPQPRLLIYLVGDKVLFVSVHAEHGTRLYRRGSRAESNNLAKKESAHSFWSC